CTKAGSTISTGTPSSSRNGLGLAPLRSGGVGFSGGLALRAAAQGLRDASDRGVPVGRRPGRRQVAGGERLGGTATVAKNAGARSPRVVHRLMPLHGIDVAGEHPGHLWVSQGTCGLNLSE